MSEALSEQSHHLSDLPPPTRNGQVVSLLPISTGPRQSPKQIVYFYDDVEWENFVREWVTTLDVNYIDVKRFGGAGDRGIDVAGMLSVDGIKGPWDCFQCKHYKQALTQKDVWPEFFKLFRYVLKQDYVLPRKYVLLAPKGCGPTLDRLLSAPIELKKRFIADLTKPEHPLRKEVEAEEYAAILKFAESLDFSIFRSEHIDDVLMAHKKTSYYVERFGQGLPDRPAVEPPPALLKTSESRYVGQLMDIYAERYPGNQFNAESILAHEVLAGHFRRQRETFFSAEALKSFARDSLPEETFDSLQDEIYVGVVDVADRSFDSGMDRLSNVLQAAVDLNLTANILLSVTRVHDRKGMCHQLANVNKLTWLEGGQP